MIIRKGDLLRIRNTTSFFYITRMDAEGYIFGYEISVVGTNFSPDQYFYKNEANQLSELVDEKYYKSIIRWIWLT